MKINENNMYDRDVVKNEIDCKINVLCEHLSKLVKIECSEMHDEICSHIQILSMTLEIANKEKYNYGLVGDDTKKRIVENFNYLSKNLCFDYNTLILFSEVIAKLEKVNKYSNDNDSRKLHDIILVNKFCKSANKLSGAILESVINTDCVKISTVNNANLLAHRLVKISSEYAKLGHFDKSIIDTSNIDSICTACHDIYNDTGKIEILVRCEELEKVLTEIKNKLNEGC